MSLLVAKVGGSLYDLPDLRQRLHNWLTMQTAEAILLVPGGGEATNVLRDLHRIHKLSEIQSHFLALHSLELNAHFLSTLLGDLRLVHSPHAISTGTIILNAVEFCARDDPDGLPMSWEATSDAIAARAAIVFDADELILLKSVEVSPEWSWEQLANAGIVDPVFPALAAQIPKVRIVNLRAMMRS